MNATDFNLMTMRIWLNPSSLSLSVYVQNSIYESKDLCSVLISCGPAAGGPNGSSMVQNSI